MRKKKMLKILSLFVAASIFVAGCSSNSGSVTNSEGDTSNTVKKEVPININDVVLRDKDALYENDDETSVVTMYLTVSRGNDAENTNHSWEEINTYSVYDYNDMGVDRYRVNGLLQVGDEYGPTEGSLGYGEVTPNATVQIRGQTSSRNQQKNYKIELKENKGTWRDQRSIALNKHQSDDIRFRNKLAYDLIKDIPQMMGLRTQFVHLYVKDETSGPTDTFSDYGLYTQVEQLNKRALKAHGMDSEGHLYKINNFEFYRYEDVIKLETDPTYDKKAFETRIENKGNSDNTKLIEMLDIVNDRSIPINAILDEYFNIENLTYWMAFQILTGNIDTDARNVYIYSPLNSNTWYFLDWDNDAFFKRTEYSLENWNGQGSWMRGISNYWGNVLFQRCLQSDDYRKALDDAILDLKDFLSEERLSTMIASYREVVRPYAFSMPDVMNIGITSEQYDQICSAIPGEVEINYQQYLESLEKPMPFYIAVPTIQNGKLHLAWEPAYDFDAENITYTVEVASDYLFQNVLFSLGNITMPEADMDIPAVGQYFVRVRATNESGYTQDAFDNYITDDGFQDGMKCFYILPDGTVGEDIIEE